MIPTWGTSTGRNSAGGIPSLLLDFSNQSYLLNGTGYAAFGGSPGITFSRGTNATMIDSTGKITYAPSNQLLNSESFGVTTSWGRNNIADVSANTSVAPNGTTTADKIIPNTTSGDHSVGESIGTVQSGNIYTLSVYAKAGGYNFIRLSFGNTAGGGLTFFDLLNGIVGVTSGMLNNTIENVGNGWFRCSVTRAAASTAVLGADLYVQSADNQFGWAGNGTDGVLFWGAQIGQVTYETAPRAYNSTTPKNLLGFTEEFNNAGWTKANASITANAIADPNGYLNAEKLVEDTATTEHFVDQPFTAISATTYTYSAYAKAGERNQIVLRFAVGTVFVGGSVQVGFTLTGSGSSFGISGSPTGSSITALSNGWYRCSISVLTVAAVAATPSARVQLYDGTSSNYTGNGTSGAYIWGAQLSDSASVNPYVYNPAAALTSTAYYGPRFEYDPAFTYSTNNLIPYANPQDFSNASFWTKARATAPATTATADPTGSYTAYKLTEDKSENLTHLIQWQGVNTAVTAGVQYTFSGYVKLADAARSAVQVAISTDNGAFTLNGGTIDLITGAVSGVTGASPIVTDVGNGWWRWSITATATASALCILRVQLVAGGTNSYVGNGTSGAYIWGAQLTESAAAVPFYYYSRTPNPLGLLIEEARTNLIFPSDANASWTASPPSSIVATANAATSPDGTTNATKIATGNTATNGHTWYRLYTGAVSTTYCGSAYLKAGEYTRAQISFDNSSFAVPTGALFDLAAGRVVDTGGGSTATITPVGNGWYRCSVTATSVAISGNFVFITSPKPALITTFDAFYTPASTGLGVYVYGAQVETGAFATSYIPTTSASATRSADIATMVGNNFSNWYNQNNGTFSVTTEASANASAEYLEVCDVSNSSNSFYFDNSGGSMRNIVASGSSVVAILNLSAVGTVGAINKLAGTYALNDFAASRNGGTVVTDTVGAVPVGVFQMNIGRSVNAVASTYISNHIKSISYYNTRLPDAQLQALTA